MMINDNDKRTFIAPYSSGLIGALNTLQLKEKFDKTSYCTLFMLKCLQNKNVFKIVLNVSTEFAALSEYGSSFQDFSGLRRHGVT